MEHKDCHNLCLWKLRIFDNSYQDLYSREWTFSKKLLHKQKWIQESYQLLESNFEASVFSFASSVSYLLKYSPISTWFTSSSAFAINATAAETSVFWHCHTVSLYLWGDAGTFEKPEVTCGNCWWLIAAPATHSWSLVLSKGTGISRLSRRNKLSFVHRLFALLMCSIWNTAHTSYRLQSHCCNNKFDTQLQFLSRKYVTSQFQCL